MCGFGLWISTTEASLSWIDNCKALLASRGPDELTIRSIPLWDGLVATCVHARLKVTGLQTDDGVQPWMSPCESLLLFNGEIYNYLQLKSHLFGNYPSGLTELESDTAILGNYISVYGVLKTTLDSDGMWAFAWIDYGQKKVILSRDLFGQKPLYYCYKGDALCAGSDPRVCHEGFGQASVTTAVEYFGSTGLVDPGGNGSVSPGHILEFRYNISNKVIEEYSLVDYRKEKYSALVRKKYQNKSVENDPDIEKSIIESVIRVWPRELAPCVFLSGGLDSGLITWAARTEGLKVSSHVSFDFGIDDYTEREQVEKFADNVGIDVTYLTVDKISLDRLVMNIPKQLGFPFFDFSIIPLLILCEHVSRQTKVAMTGDGGDELFEGYRRSAFRTFKSIKLGKLGLAIRNFLPRNQNPRGFGKLDAVSVFGTIGENYASLMGAVPTRFWRSGVIRPASKVSIYKIKNFSEVASADAQFYLPNDILVKSDRAGMAHGVELRAPFLSDIMLSASINTFLTEKRKLFSSLGKVPLRTVYNENIGISNQAKRGFTPPLPSWIANELELVVEEYVWKKDLPSYQVLDYSQILKLKKEVSQSNNSEIIWSIMMFNIWAAT